MTRRSVSTPNALSPRGRGLAALRPRTVAFAIMLCGCALTPNKSGVQLPARFSMKADQLHVISDFKLTEAHPVISDLKQLRSDVAATLDIDPGQKPVVVYLFMDEAEYAKYWQATYPAYPSRRAYFIKSPDGELAVYTSWSERVREDLRHEYTHGLLHAALADVPLWLDEGLAEYFEVSGSRPGGMNSDYAPTLAKAIQMGTWRPDLKRLEKLQRIEDMQRADYRESWAWVHFLLHHSPETRAVLISYLHDLKTNKAESSLRDRLVAVLPQANQRFLHYVATLPTTGGRLTGDSVIQTGGELPR